MKLSVEELKTLWDYISEGDDEQSVLTRRLWAEFVQLTTMDLDRALLAELRIVKFAVVSDEDIEGHERISLLHEVPSGP